MPFSVDSLRDKRNRLARRCKLEAQSIGQFLAMFGTSYEIHQQALSARPQRLGCQRASDRQFGMASSSTIPRDHSVIWIAHAAMANVGQQRRDDLPRGVSDDGSSRRTFPGLG